MSLSRNEEEVITFQHLPIDVLFNICDKLSLNDLMSAAAVSKSLFPVALSNRVWQFKYEQYFPDEKISDYVIAKSESNPFFWYEKVKARFKKSFDLLKDATTKKNIFCLIEGRIDELEAMNFELADFDELFESAEEIAGETGNHFDFRRWLSKKYFGHKSLNYIFSKVEQEFKKVAAQDRIPFKGAYSYAILLGQSIEVFNKYLEAFIKADTVDSSAIELALNYDRPDLLPTLIAHGADVNYSKGAALKTALENGDLNSCAYLIKQGAKTIFIDSDCLIRVIENGHLHVLKYLLDPVNKFEISDPKSLTKISQKALKKACECGQLEIMQYLFNLFQFNIKHYIQAFNIACKNGRLEIIQYLIPKLQKMDPTLKIESIIADGFLAAANRNQLNVVEYLYKTYKGRIDNKVFTQALLYATSKYPYDVVNFLLQKNIKIEYKFDLSGFPAMDKVSFKDMLNFFPQKHIDAPPIVVNWRFLFCIAQACHILQLRKDEKKAAAFVELGKLVVNNINTPIEQIINKWGTSNNLTYKEETNFKIISEHLKPIKQFNAMITSNPFVSAMVGLFSSEEAEKNKRESTTDALNLINDMIAYSKQYNFAQNKPTSTKSL